MTSEKRIVVGIEDLRSLSLECNKCKARLTYSFGNVGKVPLKCPNPTCNEEWCLEDMIYNVTESKRPVLLRLFSAITEARQKIEGDKVEKPTQSVGFRILLEFDETK